MNQENREIKSVKDLIIENEELHTQIEFLQKENKRLLTEHRDMSDEISWYKRQTTALKMRCSRYSRQINDLENEIKDMKFTHKMLNSEEAGKAFAQSLIGGH